MIKLLLCSLVALASTSSFAQATLLSETFETGGASWLFSGDFSENDWVTTSCAGNGTTTSGINSMYVSPFGGSLTGCNPGEIEQFAYANAAPGTTHSIIAHHTVDATCASALQLSYDYSIDGASAQDFAEVVYSTDGGATWIVLGSAFPISTSWTTSSTALPAFLDGTSFELGFRFTFDDITIVGNPLAFDNVSLTGTDNTPPAFNCFSPIALPVGGSCLAIVGDYTKTEFTLSDNCTDSMDIVVTQDIPEFTVISTGPGSTEIITLTATDEAGNSTQCFLTINIIDATPPVPVCPADTTGYVDNNCNGVLPDYTSFVVKTDNCSSPSNITVSQSPAPGLIVNGAIVVTNITMTATDESGNSATCNFIMRTLDTIPTLITCPPDTNLAVGTDCLFTLGDYFAGGVLVDNCAPLSSLIVTQSPAPGTVVSIHQVITLTVSGGVPSDESCTFNAWLFDTIAPAIICPTGINQYVDNSCTISLADFTLGAAITENCSALVTVTQSPLPGTLLGPTALETITLTVADSAGNTDMCVFYLPILDTISPTAICPGDQQEVGNTSCQATLGNYTSLVVQNDNCSAPGNNIITQSPAAGTVFSGTQMVTMTVQDEAGNTRTCNFNVSVNDQTNPTINCPANQTVGTTSSCDYSLADFTTSATGSDNCTPFGSLTYSQLPIAGTLLTAGNHTIAITVQDAAGNSTSCSFNLLVEDQINPIFNVCPPTQTAIVDANCEATLANYMPLATTSDNCSSGMGITLTQNPVAGTTISTTILVTLTATDEAGNSSNCIFNVVLNDTINPSVVCPSDQVVAIDASCGYAIPSITGLVGGADNCSALANMTISQNPVAGTPESGITPVLITLTDENGNSTTCITSISPNDITPPTITCPTSANASAGTSCNFTLPNYAPLTLITDNCPNYSFSQSPPVGASVPVGTNPITVTVLDAAGNSASCTFNLIVTETLAPTITCPNDIVSCDPVVLYSLPSYADNCGATLVQTDVTGFSSGSTFPIGITILSYEAIDTSGNSQGCNFRIEVLEYPSVANIAMDTMDLCSSSTTILTADPATSGTGIWTVSSGQGVFNNEFANLTGLNNIAFGTNVYVWTISTAQCGSLSDSIVVIRNEAPLPTSIAADTIYSCSNNTVNLVATAPSIGSGIWTVSPQTTIALASSNITTANLPNDGWYTFTWTVTNGSCPSTTDSVAVFFSSGNTNASDSAICIENGSVQLIANPLLAEQFGYWHFISGGGLIDDLYSSQTSVNNLQNGLNSIVWEVSNPNCPTQSDTVMIVVSVCNGFDSAFPTVITPNYDGKNDLFVIEYLELIYPDCRVTIVNRWGSVVFESVGYAEAWNGTFKGEPLPLGTYFYRIELNDADGTVYTGDISIIR